MRCVRRETERAESRAHRPLPLLVQERERDRERRVRERQSPPLRAARHSETVCETLTDYRVQKQTSDPARERERQRERRSQRVLPSRAPKM